MKRSLVVAVLSLVAVFVTTSLAVGAGSTKSKTTSKVSPKRDKTKPYSFKVTGKVTFPLKFCAPNAPASDCLPLVCPPGATNPAYCTKPTIGQVCSGKVKIKFKKKGTSVSRSTSLKPNCTYSKRVRIKRKGKYKVTVRFGGNTILAASSASAKRARAG